MRCKLCPEIFSVFKLGWWLIPKLKTKLTDMVTQLGLKFT